MSRKAAIGFRVKSGRAVAVLLAGSVRAPEVVESYAIQLSDPAIPATRQPYHAAMGRAQTDVARIRKLVRVVQRCAHRSVGDLAKRCRAAGYQVHDAGLVVGSDIDPARIANQHIRAHDHEGRLFRTAVEMASTRCGLEPTTLVEKRLLGEAGVALHRPEADLKRALTRLGGDVAGPWRADEKMAALAAWLVLSRA
jgi:hypothetical protein